MQRLRSEYECGQLSHVYLDLNGGVGLYKATMTSAQMLFVISCPRKSVSREVLYALLYTPCSSRVWLLGTGRWQLVYDTCVTDTCTIRIVTE